MDELVDGEDQDHHVHEVKFGHDERVREERLESSSKQESPSLPGTRTPTSVMSTSQTKSLPGCQGEVPSPGVKGLESDPFDHSGALPVPYHPLALERSTKFVQATAGSDTACLLPLSLAGLAQSHGRGTDRASQWPSPVTDCPTASSIDPCPSVPPAPNWPRGSPTHPNAAHQQRTGKPSFCHHIQEKKARTGSGISGRVKCCRWCGLRDGALSYLSALFLD
jgi:hypothetical protein